MKSPSAKSATRPLFPLLACAALATAPAARADVVTEPGDYTALPAGTNLALLYAQFPRADDLYSDGKKVVSNLDLSLEVGIFRYVHFMKLGSYTIDPQIIIPFGRQEIGLTGTKTSGIGDIIFGGTLWTIADLQNGEHLGWSIWVTAPTGSDKNEGYALSNNRWAIDFQTGYIKKLSDHWTLDLTGEVEFYQDQRKSDAQKDPLFEVQSHLRYHLSDATFIAGSYRHVWGAKETLGSTTLANEKNNGTAKLTLGTFLNKQWQVLLQYSQDVSVKEGPKVGGFQGRLLYAF